MLLSELPAIQYAADSGDAGHGGRPVLACASHACGKGPTVHSAGLQSQSHLWVTKELLQHGFDILTIVQHHLPALSDPDLFPVLQQGRSSSWGWLGKTASMSKQCRLRQPNACLIVSSSSSYDNPEAVTVRLTTAAGCACASRYWAEGHGQYYLLGEGLDVLPEAPCSGG